MLQQARISIWTKAKFCMEISYCDKNKFVYANR